MAAVLRLAAAHGGSAMALVLSVAALDHLRHRLRSKPRRRRADAPAGAGGPAAAAAAAPPVYGPALLDPEELDSSSPEAFYLPDASYEALSDCFALIEGRRLPLHRQMLAARASVLLELFVAQGEAVGGGGGGGSQEPVELSSAFAGCSLLEAAVFLRLVYAPDQATTGSLRAVHQHSEGLLAAVASLAHRLNAAALLASIEAYLQMASSAADTDTDELIDSVQLAESCHLSALGDTCLSLLARRLAAAGPFWHEQVSQEQLAECNAESLASLVCKMAGTVHAGAFEPPTVHNVLAGRRGAGGGFTWVIHKFSKQHARLTSPWIDVGGLEWRLKVWPKGDDNADGEHLSAYLECNWAHAEAHGVVSAAAYYDFAFLDQSEEGLHYTVDCGKDVFTSATQNWGKTRMVPLAELARPERSFLLNDRLAVRISIRVAPPTRGRAAPAAAAALAPPA